MRILLDSHALIWWTLNREKLSPRANDLLADRNHELLLSVVSIWEMQIKIQLRKLTLDLPLPEIIENQRKINNLQILAIKLSHIWALEKLANYHKDPFDRLLIAQAIAENLPILSIDGVFDSYAVQRWW